MSPIHLLILIKYRSRERSKGLAFVTLSTLKALLCALWFACLIGSIYSL